MPKQGETHASQSDGQRPGRFARAALMMVGSSALIAVTSLLAKVLGRGVNGSPLHPFQVSAGRFFFALVVLSMVGAWLRPSFAGAAWGVHLGRSLFGWAGISCMFAAVARMPLAEATALAFLSPIATMALAIPLLREPSVAIRWIAAGISIIGALILVRPGLATFQPAALIALSAALLMGCEIVLIKLLSGREPPMRILLVNNAMGTMIAVTAAMFVWSAPSPAQWGMLALLGATMAASQTLLIQAMKSADAGYAIPFSYVTLVFAALYDLALFGDWPDMASLAGMAVIVAGALLLALRTIRQ
jgi:drug/metabolite transporter (DMT)-like permease